MISRTRLMMVVLWVTWLVRPTNVVGQDPAAPEALPSITEEASPLVKEPTTAAEYMDAVLFTMKLARPEAAKKYVEGLLALDPDDATLIAFRTQHGTATFLQLARTDALNPAATDLLERLNAASTRQANDPAFLDSVLKNLSGNPREVDFAIRDLQHLGAPAASRLVVAASDPNSGVNREKAFTALTRMGQAAVSPLIGYIDYGTEDQRMLAVDAFGWVAAKDDTPHLYFLAYASEESGVKTLARRSLARILFKDANLSGRLDGFGAAAQLRSTAEKLLKSEIALEPEDDGLIPIWVPGDSGTDLTEKRVSPRSAAVYRAEQFARQSLLLAPADVRTQGVLLNTILTRDIEAVGWEQPIPTGSGSAHEVAILAGSQACLDALRLANESGSTAAAESLVRALARNGSLALLRSGGQRGAVVAALDHPSLRVQFAAAEAILTWDPQQPFAGSRRVVEVLAQALNSDARANGVVIDPNNARGSTMATFLTEMGYESQIARTGAEGFEAAAGKGDVELALMHLNTIQWDLSPTIANFRADARTRNLPIAIYGPAGFRGSVEHLLSQFSNVTYVEESVLSRDLTRQLQPFLAQVEPPALSAVQQSEHAKSAAKWLRKIAESRSHIYDLTPAADALIQAVARQDVGIDAMVALSVIPTGDVQQRLADMALTVGDSVERRSLAANLTAAHIRRHHCQLSDDQRKQIVEAVLNEVDPKVRVALAGIVGAQSPNPEGLSNLLLQAAPAKSPNP
jgi:hypothetical protein